MHLSHPDDRYDRVADICSKLEHELKALQRWQDKPLPESAFENMGAFGSNTMTFEQWIQFILIPRLHEIVDAKKGLPQGSMLGAYAVRAFDGDDETDHIQVLLRALDDIANGEEDYPLTEFTEVDVTAASTNETVTLGDTTVPEVLHTIGGILHHFEGDDLESQLQTFDIFLGILAPSVRPQISTMLRAAAAQSTHAATKERIIKAADDVAQGKKASKF